MTAAAPLSNAERTARRRAKDVRKGIVQVNIRVPALYDVALKILAEELRKGLKLEGFVLRSPKTGRVQTMRL